MTLSPQARIREGQYRKRQHVMRVGAGVEDCLGTLGSTRLMIFALLHLLGSEPSPAEASAS